MEKRCEEGRHRQECSLEDRKFIESAAENMGSEEYGGGEELIQISGVSWNTKVSYCARHSQPLVPVLSQKNPFYAIPSYLRSILILSSHLHLGL